MCLEGGVYVNDNVELERYKQGVSFRELHLVLSALFTFIPLR